LIIDNLRLTIVTIVRLRVGCRLSVAGRESACAAHPPCLAGRKGEEAGASENAEQRTVGGRVFYSPPSILCS